MTHEDEQCLKLGRMIVRMIHDVRETPCGTAYGRRRVTYPGGAVELFVVKDVELADKFEKAAAKDYSVEAITLKSGIN